MDQWFVIKTRPNCEKMAVQNLRNQDFEYYLPMILEKHVRKCDSRTVESPLFPSYLFVKVQEVWRSILGTRGVSDIIGQISDNIIQDLKRREVNGYIQLPKAKRFAVGDTVKITSGPFANQQALVQRMPTKERQKVLLALLSNQISVLISEEDIA
jgi:transcriptional antiterminator RfaH